MSTRVARRLARKAAARPPKAAARRDCGACAACCYAMAVEALGKSKHTECVHRAARGCAQYAGRPSECRTYGCAWWHGHGYDDERPDEIGMLLTFPAPGSCDGWDTLIGALELEPGALRRGDNQLRIARWTQRGMRVVLSRLPDA